MSYLCGVWRFANAYIYHKKKGDVYMLSIYKREFVTEMPLAFVLTLAGMATLILPREMMLQKVGILGVLLMMLMSVVSVVSGYL